MTPPRRFDGIDGRRWLVVGETRTLRRLDIGAGATADLSAA